MSSSPKASADENRRVLQQRLLKHEVRFYGHPCPSYAKTQYLCEWPKVLPFAEAGADYRHSFTGRGVAASGYRS